MHAWQIGAGRQERDHRQVTVAHNACLWTTTECLDAQTNLPRMYTKYRDARSMGKFRSSLLLQRDAVVLAQLIDQSEL